MEKKLYRAKEGKILTGVCAGLGKYFNLDPLIIRIVCIIFGCCGAGILAYLLVSFLIPEAPDQEVIDA